MKNLSCTTAFEAEIISEMKHHGHQRVQRRPLLREFAPLFYVCKILGINSQDYVEFRQYKNLEKSESGDLYAIVFLVTIFINYNLMVWVFHDPEYSSEKGEYIHVSDYD